MRINVLGLLDAARFLPSPNSDARPPGVAVELLVIHNISLPPGVFNGNAVCDLFLNRLDPGAHPYFAEIAALRVSAHFFVRRDGEIIQFVPCIRRAWHAGLSQWQGRQRCNDFSLGIELEGTDHEPYTDPQYERLIALARAIYAAYPIRDTVGHCDIAPGRKTDPGQAFDWSRYRRGLMVSGPASSPD